MGAVGRPGTLCNCSYPDGGIAADSPVHLPRVRADDVGVNVTQNISPHNPHAGTKDQDSNKHLARGCPRTVSVQLSEAGEGPERLRPPMPSQVIKNNKNIFHSSPKVRSLQRVRNSFLGGSPLHLLRPPTCHHKCPEEPGDSPRKPHQQRFPTALQVWVGHLECWLSDRDAAEKSVTPTASNTPEQGPPFRDGSLC